MTMTAPPTTRQIQADTDTPALCRKLAQLLTVWQQIEAGKNPVWEVLSMPFAHMTTSEIYDHLGNVRVHVSNELRKLRMLALISTQIGDGNQRFHDINYKNETIVRQFVATLWPTSDPHDAIQTTIEKCQAIGHKSGLPFALWQAILQEPHTSGQAATAVGCSAGEASKALGKLVDCGLAQAPIHKGQFRIYRGIDGLSFLQDAQSLVEAGIIKL